MCGLWSPDFVVDFWWGLVDVRSVWCLYSMCGLVFSLSLGVMSGLLPWIYPYDSVSCTSLKGDFHVPCHYFHVLCHYVIHFSLLNFFLSFSSIFFVLILFLAVCLLAVLISPKLLLCYVWKPFFFFFPVCTSLLHVTKSYFNKICTLIMCHFQRPICDHDIRENHSKTNLTF